jgi:hypothetical protein
VCLCGVFVWNMCLRLWTNGCLCILIQARLRSCPVLGFVPWTRGTQVGAIVL